jgi:hypothetical protein
VGAAAVLLSPPKRHNSSPLHPVAPPSPATGHAHGHSHPHLHVHQLAALSTPVPLVFDTPAHTGGGGSQSQPQSQFQSHHQTRGRRVSAAGPRMSPGQFVAQFVSYLVSDAVVVVAQLEDEVDEFEERGESSTVRFSPFSVRHRAFARLSSLKGGCGAASAAVEKSGANQMLGGTARSEANCACVLPYRSLLPSLQPYTSALLSLPLSQSFSGLVPSWMMVPRRSTCRRYTMWRR